MGASDAVTGRHKEAPNTEKRLHRALRRKISFRGTVQKVAVPCGFRERYSEKMTNVEGPMTKEFPTGEKQKRANPSAKFELRIAKFFTKGSNVEWSYFLCVKIVNAGTSEGKVNIWEK